MIKFLSFLNHIPLRHHDRKLILQFLKDKKFMSRRYDLCRSKVCEFYYIGQPKPDINNNLVKSINPNIT